MKKSDFALYEKNGKIYSMGFEFNNLLKEQEFKFYRITCWNYINEK